MSVKNCKRLPPCLFAFVGSDLLLVVCNTKASLFFFSDLQHSTSGVLMAWEPSSALGESPGITHCNELCLRKAAPREGMLCLGRWLLGAHVVTRMCPQPCCSDLPLIPELRAAPPVVGAPGAWGLLPLCSQSPNMQILSLKFCTIILCVATAFACL